MGEALLAVGGEGDSVLDQDSFFTLLTEPKTGNDSHGSGKDWPEEE